MFKKLKAFTMAEVLITVGIIGVVAAMTIPTLNSNVNAHQNAVALKKISASLTDKFRAQMAAEGVDVVGDLQAFVNSSTKEQLMKEFADFLPFAGGLEGGYQHKVLGLNGKVPTDTNLIINPWPSESTRKMTNGAFLNIFSYEQNGKMMTQESQNPVALRNMGSSLLYRYGIFYIDVNGYAKPNRLGYDIFKFYLGQDGMLYPVGGVEVARYHVGVNDILYDKTDYQKYNCILGNTESWGFGCAGRVEDNDWSINYLSMNSLHSSNTGGISSTGGGLTF